MAAIATITPSIAIHAPEVPQAVLEAVVIEVARDFCRRTHAVRVDHATVNTVGGTRGYTLTAPVSTELLDVLTVKFPDKAPLVKTTPRSLQNLDDSWEQEVGEPDAFWLIANTLNFWPTPQGAQAAAVRISVMPALAASVIPDELARFYEIALRHGVLARLFSMPRKPWTDKGEAKFHEAMFFEEVNQATHKAANEHQHGVVRKTGYGGI